MEVKAADSILEKKINCCLPFPAGELEKKRARRSTGDVKLS